MNIDVHDAGWCLTRDGKFHHDLWEACRHLIASGVCPEVKVRFRNRDREFLRDRIGNIAQFTPTGRLWTSPYGFILGSPSDIWWRGVMFKRRFGRQ